MILKFGNDFVLRVWLDCDNVRLSCFDFCVADNLINSNFLLLDFQYGFWLKGSKLSANAINDSVLYSINPSHALHS